MAGASSSIEEEQLKERESGREELLDPGFLVECTLRTPHILPAFRMEEDMSMECNNEGVSEDESSEDESHPRTRRMVTDCASSSASGASTAAALPPTEEPCNPQSIMETAAEIEQQLSKLGAQPHTPTLQHQKTKSRTNRSNVIPHHQRVGIVRTNVMTRIEEDSVSVPPPTKIQLEQQRQEYLKKTRITTNLPRTAEPTMDVSPPAASGLGVMGGNLRKILSNQGQQSHLDRFGIQKMIMATDYNSAWEPVPNITELRDQRTRVLDRLSDHPSKPFLISREKGIVQFTRDQPNARVNWLSYSFAAMQMWSDSVSVVPGHPEYRPLLRAMPACLSSSRNAVRLITTVAFEDHNKRIRFGQYESDGLTFEDLYQTQPGYVSWILSHVSTSSSETVGGFKEFALYCLYRQTIPDVQP